MQLEQSKDSLLTEVIRLREDIAALNRENQDLKLLIDVNLEHSDSITENLLHKVKDILSESEKQFRLIIEIIPIPVIISRISDHRIVYANQASLQLLNLSTETVIDKELIQFYDEYDQQVIMHKFTKNKKIKNYELRGAKNNGDIFWSSLSTESITFKNEPCIINVLYDLTERKRSEEYRQKLEEKLRKFQATRFFNALNSINSFIVIEDQNYNIQFENKFVREMFGDDLSKKCYEKYIGRQEPCEICPIKEILHGDKTNFIYYPETADKIFKSFSNKIENIDGTASIIEILTDITDQKHSEEKISNLNKELIKSNQELKETTAQLIQTAKISALGEMSAGIAHEMNQPLNAVKIIAQSLLRDVSKNRLDVDELGHELKEIIDQINRMAGIIEHVTLFTRFSDTELMDPIDINTTIQGPFKVLGQQLKIHNIELNQELSPDLPKIMGNLIRLEQVFINLITNARHALDNSDKKQKKIEIKTYQQGSTIIAAVTDNANGIPEAIKEKIFQPFFTTKGPGKGTGLGLSISNKIIQEHKGTIELESEVGVGTTFKVILPINQ
ncbi:MAG: PAS domain S-box protein [Desulfobacterales bacterium]|nr:PAS domain S-box protein [Desulfobacterales bacterium]